MDVIALSFPADARPLSVLTSDGVLRTCDVAAGTWGPPAARTAGPGDRVRFAGGRVSPDRTRFLYTPYDGTANWIEVFAVGEDRPLLRVADPEFSPHEGRAASVSADNRWLAAVPTDGVIKVWDLATGRPAAAYRPPEGVFYFAAVSPDGKSVVGVYGPKVARLSSSMATSLVVLDRATGAERFRAAGWQGLFVTSSPDGTRLVGLADGGVVLVADAATGAIRHRLRGHGTGRVAGHAFSADGRRLVTGGQDHTAIWDSATGKPALDFAGVAFSPDGTRLGTGGRDTSVLVWDLTAGP